jgi:hypothetical protein
VSLKDISIEDLEQLLVEPDSPVGEPTEQEYGHFLMVSAWTAPDANVLLCKFFTAHLSITSSSL